MGRRHAVGGARFGRSLLRAEFTPFSHFPQLCSCPPVQGRAGVVREAVPLWHMPAHAVPRASPCAAVLSRRRLSRNRRERVQANGTHSGLPCVFRAGGAWQGARRGCCQWRFAPEQHLAFLPRHAPPVPRHNLAHGTCSSMLGHSSVVRHVAVPHCSFKSDRTLSSSSPVLRPFSQPATAARVE